MGHQIVNNLFNFFPGNITAILEETVPLVTQVASAAAGALSELSYLHIGGAGLLAGAGYLGYTYYFSRKDPLTLALPFFRDNMPEHEKVNILKTIQEIPFKEREDVIQRALPLIQDHMTGYEKGYILLAVQKIPSREWKGIIQKVSPFMRDDIGGWGKSNILKIFHNIPPEERDDIIQRASSLMRHDMTGQDIIDLLKAARKIPLKEWENIIQRASSLIQNNMTGEEISYLLQVVRKISLKKWEDVIQKTLPLIRDNMKGQHKINILITIHNIPSKEREDIIQKASPFFRNNATGKEKVYLLKAIQMIPSEERKDVIQRASSLMQEDMQGQDKATILKAIQKISSEEREDVIQRASSLIRDDMRASEKAYLLSAIRIIPSEDREEVIQKALPLMRDSMTGHNKAQIVNAIRMIPAAERNERAKRAQQQIQIDFPDGEFDDIHIYSNRIIQLLETPLHQAFLPFGQDNAMAAAAAAGQAAINVHAGKRDARVKAALLLLRKAQHLSEQEINSSANECLQYLEAGGHSRALWVLNGANSSNDYGPFFKDIIIHDEPTSGQEVIGRLWKFIQALPDSEKQLALDSLVIELGRCINEDGERICDQGKMQHVFIAVLQGRLAGVQVDDSIEIPKIDQRESSSAALQGHLKGVQVDDSIEIPKTDQGESSSSGSSQSVPVQDAMRLFFETPKHRMIEEFEELIEAAKRFCSENPRVNPEEFLKEMKAYAENQGIESKGKEEE